MERLKHSKIGVISFGISLIPIVFIIIQTAIDIFMVKFRVNDKIGFILLNIMVFIALISLIFGVISLFQKGTKKLFPVIGIIMSCIILSIPILGSIKILNNNLNKSSSTKINSTMNINFTPEKQIVDEDFSLRKGNIVVKLNMNKNDLLKEIGVDDLNNAPKRNVTLKNKNYQYINYNFQNLNITLTNANSDESGRKEDDFIVKLLETDSNEWETYRGVKVGGDINKVENIYGKLIRSEGENGFSLILAKDNYLINFVSSSSDKQKIERISLNAK